MSAEWSFYSFRYERFEKLFGGGSESEEQALVDIITDEAYYDFDDPEMAEEVARRAIREGLSYQGADEESRDVLDCIPSAVLKDSDTLVEYVNAGGESPQGLHINVVSELLDRAEGRLELRLLRLFSGGRRYGETDSDYCEYVIFTPSEVKDLLGEAGEVVALDVQWSHPDFPTEVENELLQPLRKVSAQGRGLAAFYP